MSDVYSLIVAYRGGDREAGERLIRENNGLIWAIVKRFVGRGVESDDLYQLGCLGFLKAVQGYDAAFGTQFSTYAVPKISGEIRRFLRDDGAIKVSRSVKEQASAVKMAQAALTQELGREPAISEISERCGLSAEEIAYAQAATAATESIQRESGEEGFSLEDVLTDTESEEKMAERLSLRQAIDSLPERERTVVQLRYFHGLTQERVSRVLGVSQVQVSRIEKKAIGLLREAML
ncbi:MAG: SigB/SigF/SigG family RNA polymerase sigma factor [Firmicutes bacterium]|nr:SigB/SigF/SigG family RNA polymerase sigma factor [Bacillota bacterium]